MNTARKLIANELMPVYQTTDKGEKIVDGRELHNILQSKQEFANWMKNRIEKYGFIEGEDFLTTLSKTSGGRPATDYVLKLDMAKELAMVENNEQGRKARKYFIEVEKKFKSQPNTTQLSPQLQFLIQMEQRQNALEETVTTIQDTLLNRDENWRKSINTMLNRSAFKLGGQYRDIRKKSYEILEERAHCNLNQRLRNMLDRLEQSGATKTTINNASKLDVIENDVRLKEIYTTIVKELSIGSLKVAR